MRLSLIVLVALSVAADSQQAILRVTASSQSEGGSQLVGTTVTVDVGRCAASFRYCNSCNIDLMIGMGMCTEMWCGSDSSLGQSVLSDVITEHGKRICEESKKIELGEIAGFSVNGKSGSMSFVGEAK